MPSCIFLVAGIPPPGIDTLHSNRFHATFRNFMSEKTDVITKGFTRFADQCSMFMMNPDPDTGFSKKNLIRIQIGILRLSMPHFTENILYCS
jgi:hypothetical protein